MEIRVADWTAEDAAILLRSSIFVGSLMEETRADAERMRAWMVDRELGMSAAESADLDAEYYGTEE